MIRFAVRVARYILATCALAVLLVPPLLIGLTLGLIVHGFRSGFRNAPQAVAWWHAEADELDK